LTLLQRAIQPQALESKCNAGETMPRAKKAMQALEAANIF